jgi:hypothetical protein
MSFLEWLETTSVAEWGMASLIGYPLIITMHSIGLALMVGPVILLDLRFLGYFKRISFEYFGRILILSWIGFAFSFVSGIILFTMYATEYASHVWFLTKITLVVLGAVATAYQHSMILKQAHVWEESSAPILMARIAQASIVFWAGVIVAGRLIAYT